MRPAPPTTPGEIPREPAPALIPYQNPAALTGYYVSIISLIPVVGLIAGPAAVILGALGLRSVRRDPHIRGTAHAIVAIVVGGLTTLLNWGVALLVVVLAASRP